MTPEVGRGIAWADIVRQVFRVLDFDRDGTAITPDGKVIAASKLQPYGYLTVESPILNQSVRLPIIHRDDFLLAASVFDDPQWIDAIKEDELLVTYAPYRTLLNGRSASISHVLHYVIVPRGTLARYYEVDSGAYMVNPAPEKLFGEMAWEGEISERINSQPQL